MGSGVMASRPVAPSPLRTGRLARDLQILLGQALGGAQVELLGRLVVLVDGPARGAAELHGPGHDGREHGRELERRADRLADLAQRRELADRARQRRRPLLQLLEQPGVLDGDHGLVGEGLQQLDLAVGERPGLDRGSTVIAPMGSPSRSSGTDEHASEARRSARHSRARYSGSSSHVRDVDDWPRRGALAPARCARPGGTGNASPERLDRLAASTPVRRPRGAASPSNRSTTADVGAAQPRRVLGDGVEHRLDVGRRAAMTRRISPVAVCCSRASLSVACCAPPAP